MKIASKIISKLTYFTWTATKIIIILRQSQTLASKALPKRSLSLLSTTTTHHHPQELFKHFQARYQADFRYAALQFKEETTPPPKKKEIKIKSQTPPSRTSTPAAQNIWDKD